MIVVVEGMEICSGGAMVRSCVSAQGPCELKGVYRPRMVELSLARHLDYLSDDTTALSRSWHGWPCFVNDDVAAVCR